MFRAGSIKNTNLKLRNGNIVTLIRHDDSIEVLYKDKTFSFYFDSPRQFASTLFYIREQFLQDQYEFLKPKAKIVVDIGANVADTALYFLANGATRVYALEPNPYFYEIGQKNLRDSIDQNIESDTTLLSAYIIKFINAGVSDDVKSVKISPAEILGHFTNFKEKYSKSKSIDLLSLSDIIKRYRIPQGSVMKIDCEGHEYGFLLNASNKSLEIFDRIVIAHHDNWLMLCIRLQEAGFNIYHTPRKSENYKDQYTRLIFAERVSED